MASWKETGGGATGASLRRAQPSSLNEYCSTRGGCSPTRSNGSYRASTSQSTYVSSNCSSCKKIDILELIKPKPVKISGESTSRCTPGFDQFQEICSWFASPKYFCYGFKTPCSKPRPLYNDESRLRNCFLENKLDKCIRISTKTLQGVRSDDDMRSWSLSCEDQRRYFLELMNKDPGEAVPETEPKTKEEGSKTEVRYEHMISKKDEEIERLKKLLRESGTSESKTSLGASKSKSDARLDSSEAKPGTSSTKVPSSRPSDVWGKENENVKESKGILGRSESRASVMASQKPSESKVSAGPSNKGSKSTTKVPSDTLSEKKEEDSKKEGGDNSSRRSSKVRFDENPDADETKAEVQNKSVRPSVADMGQTEGQKSVRPSVAGMGQTEGQKSVRPSVADMGQSVRPSVADMGQAEGQNKSVRPSVADMGQAEGQNKSVRPSVADMGQVEGRKSVRPSVADMGQSEGQNKSVRASVAGMGQSVRQSVADVGQSVRQSVADVGQADMVESEVDGVGQDEVKTDDQTEESGRDQAKKSLEEDANKASEEEAEWSCDEDEEVGPDAESMMGRSSTQQESPGHVQTTADRMREMMGPPPSHHFDSSCGQSVMTPARHSQGQGMMGVPTGQYYEAQGYQQTGVPPQQHSEFPCGQQMMMSAQGQQQQYGYVGVQHAMQYGSPTYQQPDLSCEQRFKQCEDQFRQCVQRIVTQQYDPCGQNMQENLDQHQFEMRQQMIMGAGAQHQQHYNAQGNQQFGMPMQAVEMPNGPSARRTLCCRHQAQMQLQSVGQGGMPNWQQGRLPTIGQQPGIHNVRQTGPPNWQQNEMQAMPNGRQAGMNNCQSSGMPTPSMPNGQQAVIPNWQNNGMPTPGMSNGQQAALPNWQNSRMPTPGMSNGQQAAIPKWQNSGMPTPGMSNGQQAAILNWQNSGMPTPGMSNGQQAAIPNWQNSGMPTPGMSYGRQGGIPNWQQPGIQSIPLQQAQAPMPYGQQMAMQGGPSSGAYALQLQQRQLEQLSLLQRKSAYLEQQLAIKDKNERLFFQDAVQTACTHLRNFRQRSYSNPTRSLLHNAEALLTNLNQRNIQLLKGTAVCNRATNVNAIELNVPQNALMPGEAGHEVQIRAQGVVGQVQNLQKKLACLEMQLTQKDRCNSDFFRQALQAARAHLSYSRNCPQAKNLTSLLQNVEKVLRNLSQQRSQMCDSSRTQYNPIQFPNYQNHFLHQNTQNYPYRSVLPR